ncbi:MAG: heavy metal translocating P-type ATPase [Planctomycetaceae bacterium]|nr:heavy metal translocating P-type ATPase [Planctomycetaceae bacterium]
MHFVPARESRHVSSLSDNPWLQKAPLIALLATLGIAAHLVLRFLTPAGPPVQQAPLLVVLALGGLPLLADLLQKLWRREFSSDLLAGMSIVTAILLGEYLAGALVVLMLSGGEALEGFAVRRASSVLHALAKRLPSVAHRQLDGTLQDVPLEEVRPGDLLVVFPHETCPVDGLVHAGHGVMDESYLTGEPFEISKAPGSAVLSGAINGAAALTIRATRFPKDSRYAQIMGVMQAAEQNRPRIRRLGDQLGAIYTPIALALALAAWGLSGEAIRFLAVLVVATPCPLLIAIPVSIIGSISLAARRGIVIRDPAVLEQIDACRTIIFDKTGTLTYGVPELTEILPAAGHEADELLRLAATVEQYSKHPLSQAILDRARERKLALPEAVEVSEAPGKGLTGTVDGRRIEITSRKHLLEEQRATAAELPPSSGGLECLVVVNDRYAGLFRFRDVPRAEGKSFVRHLGPQHHYKKVMIVSGDRESEVRYLADRVGISDVHAGISPEGKVEIVRAETALAKTVFVGDGINDAPALMTATVGLAFGQNSDVTTQAAGAVIMDSSLERVDELFHLGERMRRIALQSAVGGMALSVLAMLVAAAGYLPPVAGAVTQEAIDVLSILNALRAAVPPRQSRDY